MLIAVPILFNAGVARPALRLSVCAAPADPRGPEALSGRRNQPDPDLVGVRALGRAVHGARGPARDRRSTTPIVRRPLQVDTRLPRRRVASDRALALRE